MRGSSSSASPKRPRLAATPRSQPRRNRGPPVPARVEEADLNAIEELLKYATAKAEGSVIRTVVVAAALRVAVRSATERQPKTDQRR